MKNHFCIIRILIERVQNKTESDLSKFFDKFLSDNWGKSLIGGDIENFFMTNNISRKDLEQIVSFDLTLFNKNSDNAKVIFQKILYLVFMSRAQEYIEIETNIVLEKLPMFMNGLVDEVKVQKNGEEKIVSRQEIIEESIIPIIAEFEEKDMRIAEGILELS